jgi:hydroxylaminobenzene mutase
VDRRSRRLLWHGVFLFYLGLLTGFLVPGLGSPTTALSSHMAGLLGGGFLVGLGLIWPRLRLPGGALGLAYWLALYGAYVKWASTLFAAACGGLRSLPIAGEHTRGAEDWQERLGWIAFVSLSAALLIVCWIVLWGLRGDGEREGADGAA